MTSASAVLLVAAVLMMDKFSQWKGVADLMRLSCCAHSAAWPS